MSQADEDYAARLAALGFRHPGSMEDRLFAVTTPLADVLAYGWADADDPVWGAVEDVRAILLGLAEHAPDMVDKALMSCARRLEAAHALARRLRYVDVEAPATQPTPSP